MEEKTKRKFLWLLDLVLNLIIIIGLVIIIQKWIIAPFDVSGASMCDSLNFIEGECRNNIGEKIIINEAGYLLGEPDRGDIIVFNVPGSENKKFFIKRIIGLPGETVEIKGGEVYITKVGESKSTKIEEEYLNETNKHKTKPFFDHLSVFEVPAGRYFVMGDNRKASTDSRSCFQTNISKNCADTPEKSFVPIENIRGKAWVVWWPVSSMRTINKVEYPGLQIPPIQSNSESLEEK